MSMGSARLESIAVPPAAAVKMCVRRRGRAALPIAVLSPLLRYSAAMTLLILWFDPGSLGEPGPATKHRGRAPGNPRSFVSVV